MKRSIAFELLRLFQMDGFDLESLLYECCQRSCITKRVARSQ